MNLQKKAVSQLVLAIRLTELAALHVNGDNDYDVSDSRLEEMGLTMEDMYNLQQLCMKLEQKHKQQ